VSASWQVTGQRQTSISRNGQFQEAMVVTFQTGDNVEGTVTIPLATYSAATVAEAINARVAQIAPVSNLSSVSGAPSSQPEA